MRRSLKVAMVVALAGAFGVGAGASADATSAPTVYQSCSTDKVRTTDTNGVQVFCTGLPAAGAVLWVPVITPNPDIYPAYLDPCTIPGLRVSNGSLICAAAFNGYFYWPTPALS